MGVQVHGGMGFVEETGAAQYLRDARILPIYEGTNGIQSADLLFRKILRDEGATMMAWIEQNEADMDLDDLKFCTAKMIDLAKDGLLDEVAELSWPFLELFGTVFGGLMLQRLAKVDGQYQDLSAFYNKHVLPRRLGFKATILGD